MGAVRNTSWYQKFNGSQSGSPLSSLDRMTGWVIIVHGSYGPLSYSTQLYCIEETRYTYMYCKGQCQVQSGAVKLALWCHWMHLSFMHQVMLENQFHCTKLYQATVSWYSVTFFFGGSKQWWAKVPLLHTTGSQSQEDDNQSHDPPATQLGRCLSLHSNFHTTKWLKKVKEYHDTANNSTAVQEHTRGCL